MNHTHPAAVPVGKESPKRKSYYRYRINPLTPREIEYQFNGRYVRKWMHYFCYETPEQAYAQWLKLKG